MIAVYVNMLAVFIGGFIGLIFSRKIKNSYIQTVMASLGIIVGVIGISGAVKTTDLLCVTICLVLGTIIGEAIKLDDKIEGLGDFVKNKFFSKLNGNGRFTEGMVTAGLVFCIGSMSVTGSLEAGINQNYSIIFAKSIIDFFTSIVFATSMGIGVVFSIIFVFIFQGGITMLANIVAPYLSDIVVVEMSAVGGAILIGMAINMLGLSKTRIKIANMLPGMFLTAAYIPLVNLIKELLIK